MDFSEEYVDEEMLDPKKKALLDLIKQMRKMIVSGQEDEELPKDSISDILEGAEENVVEPTLNMAEEAVEDMPEDMMEGEEDYSEEMPEEGEEEDNKFREELSNFMKGKNPNRKKSVSLSIVGINSKKDKDKKKKMA